MDIYVQTYYYFLMKNVQKKIKENFKFHYFIDPLTLYMKYNIEDIDDNSSLKSKNEDNNNESDSDIYPKDL